MIDYVCNDKEYKITSFTNGLTFYSEKREQLFFIGSIAYKFLIDNNVDLQKVAFLMELENKNINTIAQAKKVLNIINKFYGKDSFKEQFREMLKVWNDLVSKLSFYDLFDKLKNNYLGGERYSFFNTEKLTTYIKLENNSFKLDLDMIYWINREKGTWRFMDYEKIDLTEREKKVLNSEIRKVD